MKLVSCCDGWMFRRPLLKDYFEGSRFSSSSGVLTVAAVVVVVGITYSTAFCTIWFPSLYYRSYYGNLVRSMVMIFFRCLHKPGQQWSKFDPLTADRSFQRLMGVRTVAKVDGVRRMKSSGR